MPRSATVIAGTHAELAPVDLDKFLQLVVERAGDSRSR